MNLVLIRRWLTPQSTIGELFVEGETARRCVTLEDPVRPAKIAGQTAIPAGRYRVVVTESRRFKRPLPLLLDVPDFEGVRIHPGNTCEDTEGCILVGQTMAPDRVLRSRAAFGTLFPLIQEAVAKGRVYLTILERPASADGRMG